MTYFHFFVLSVSTLKIRTENIKSSASPESEALCHVVFRVRALTARVICQHIIDDRPKKNSNILARYFMMFQSKKQRLCKIAIPPVI
jgi:hypothetical protein